MFDTLEISGQLEERSDGTWIRGRHFSPNGLHAASADAQRAAFVIRAVRKIDGARLKAAVAPEDDVICGRVGSGRIG